MDPTLAPRDANRITGLIGLDSTDDTKTAPAAVDPVTNRLLVNATLSGVSTGDGAIVDGSDSAIRATVFDLTSSNPLATQIVDASGTAITSFGGGTQYTSGDTDATPTGTLAMTFKPADNSVNAVSTDNPLPNVQYDVAGNALTVVDLSGGGVYGQSVQIYGNSGAVSQLGIANTPLAAAILDSTGTQISDFAVYQTKGSAVGATDKGVASLAKLDTDVSQSAVDNGDYETMSVTTWKELRVRDQRSTDLQNCNDHTSVTVLGNDTSNLATSTNHVFGTGAITFDKVNGAANTVFAGVQDTITSINIQELFEDGGFVALSAYLPSLSNVVAVFLRVGTDSTNYNEWEWPTSELTAGRWLALREPTNSPAGVTGNGWDTAAITYVAFGVEFSSETNTLAGIIFDNVHLVQGRVTDSSIDTTVNSSVNTPNVNLHRVGGTPTDVNSGNKSAGSQRVVIATDDINLAAIKTAVETLDNAVSGTSYLVAGDVAAAATDSGNPVKVGAKFNSTLPTYTDGQRGDLQIEARGALRMSQTFTTNAWTAAADNADGVAVSATANKGVVVARNTVFNGTDWDRQRGDATNGTDVDVTRVIPGTSATHLGKAEDTAHTTGDTGVFILGVRNSAGTALTDTDGDYSPIATNSTGAIKIADIAGSITPGVAATNLGKAEDAGHTSGDTGVAVWGVRNNTPNTALTNADADYSQLSTDMVGGVRTALYETDFAALGTSHVKKYYTNAGAVTDGIVWSPAAGKRWYVTDIFINVSAAATVTLEDDKAGGDEVVWKAELAANSGWSHHYGTPLFSGEDAADLLVTTSAGNVYITVTGYEI